MAARRFAKTPLRRVAENIQRLLPGIRKRFVTFGLTPQSDYQAADIDFDGMRTSFTLIRRGDSLGKVLIGMPGRHNIYNALAAIAVADELEIPFEKIRESLEGFSGIQRRFQIKGEHGGITVVDDYGHHPTEIRATLSAAKKGWKRRVVAVFQPHRYSRTRDLFDDFVTSFNEADLLILTDIYPAGEKPIEGVTARRLFEEIKRHGHRDVYYVSERSEAISLLHEKTIRGDMVITMGAGNIWEVAETFYNEMKENSPLKMVKEG